MTSKHWGNIAKKWNLIGFPLRPSKEDTALFQQAINQWKEQNSLPAKALILGVTPELYHLEWPMNSQLSALDSSKQMLNSVWPGSNDDALQGSWDNIPFDDSSLDIVVCDGGFGTLNYPETQTDLLKEINRTLKTNGIFIVRLFSPAGRTGTTEEIEKDLKNNKIKDLNALKLRLWGVLHKDLSQGVKPSVVVSTIERISGSLDYLVDSLGWSSEHVKTLELHRDNNSIYHLINEDELISLAKSNVQLECISNNNPNHEYGTSCPVLTFKKKN